MYKVQTQIKFQIGDVAKTLNPLIIVYIDHYIQNTKSLQVA